MKESKYEKTAGLLLAAHGVLQLTEFLVTMRHTHMNLLHVVFLAVSIGWAVAFYLPRRELIMPLLAGVSLVQSLVLLLMNLAVGGNLVYSFAYTLGQVFLLGLLLAVLGKSLKGWLPLAKDLWFIPFAAAAVTGLIDNFPFLRFLWRQPVTILWIVTDAVMVAAMFFLCAWLKEQAQKKLASDSNPAQHRAEV